MIAGNLNVQRSQLVEVTVPANFSSNVLNIPDQPMLRDKRVTSIEVYTASDITKSPITGNALINSGQLSYLFFTGYIADPVNEGDTGEYLYRYPLVSLHNVFSFNAGSNYFVVRNTEFEELSFQWEKCSIVFAPSWPVSANPLAILLNVYYTSSKARTPRAMRKSIRGVNDGSLTELFAQKIMTIENELNAIKNRK